MDINELLKGKPEDVYKSLAVKDSAKVDISTIEKQLDPRQHDVFDVSKRPKKKVQKPTGQKDANGNAITEERDEEVTRTSIPFQKKIINVITGFMLGNPVMIKGYASSDDEKRLQAMVQRTWDDNKLSYFNRKLARTVFSYCEAAELWYLVEESGTFWQSLWLRLKAAVGLSNAGKYRLRVKMLSPKNGDKLYPHFDVYGDMDAFSREYEMTENSKKVVRFDIYTDKQIIKLRKGENGWEEEARAANPFLKIPVIYYSQDYPEWYDAQPMIDRLETLLSNLGDTNDYFGAPMVFVNGKITGFSEKGERGKVLQGDEKAQAKYLEWQSSPESTSLEINTLKELIYSMTQTPDISFSQMKGIGDISGIALKLLFLDAHLKVENKIELFGEMFQRRLNLLKSALGKIVDVSLDESVTTLELEPVFTPYLPKNVKEEIDMLSTATGGKQILSTKTALEHNPLANDVETELANMEEEANKELEQVQKNLGASFNMQ